MTTKSTRKIIGYRLIVSVGLGLVGFIMAGPILSFLVTNTDAHVASGDIASGFKMRLWVAFAFFLFLWIMEFNHWWFTYKSKKFRIFSILMLFIFSIGYAILRLFFAVQFYDFWKIDGVIQFVDLRYFNLGRHLIIGYLLGFLFSMAVGLFRRYSIRK